MVWRICEDRALYQMQRLNEIVCQEKCDTATVEWLHSCSMFNPQKSSDIRTIRFVYTLLLSVINQWSLVYMSSVHKRMDIHVLIKVD